MSLIRLLYCLQIVESFFEEFEFGPTIVDSESNHESILEESDSILMNFNHKLNWIESFLAVGGIDHLINVIIKFILDHKFK